MNTIYVFVECVNGITTQMENDTMGMVISDGGLFFVTTLQNMVNYPNVDFEVTTVKTLEEYGITPKFG